MARILVTGGPVHTRLDAVKIVTNQFKGGRMKHLARSLAGFGSGNEVYYLVHNSLLGEPGDEPFNWIGHDGFDGYVHAVTSMVRDIDMIVLGAAVANLTPEPSWNVNTEKFPSHNYDEGDLVEIPFRITPRVINMVKKENPRVKLVGFKLLSGVSRDELLSAAGTVMDESKADVVVANDRKDLDKKYILTRERGVVEIQESFLAKFLSDLADDQYYKTTYLDHLPNDEFIAREECEVFLKKYRELASRWKDDIEKHGRQPDGKLFGCIAVSMGEDEFLCSPRGKTSIDDEPVAVVNVHHENRGGDVVLRYGSRKASLNAPLLHRMFTIDRSILAILHTHGENDIYGHGENDLRGDHSSYCDPSYYAPAGTVRDVSRVSRWIENSGCFYVEGHGWFHLFRESDLKRMLRPQVVLDANSIEALVDGAKVVVGGVEITAKGCDDLVLTSMTKVP